jgi:hypothetical protein
MLRHPPGWACCVRERTRPLGPVEPPMSLLRSCASALVSVFATKPDGSPAAEAGSGSGGGYSSARHCTTGVWAAMPSLHSRVSVEPLRLLTGPVVTEPVPVSAPIVRGDERVRHVCVMSAVKGWWGLTASPKGPSLVCNCIAAC